MPLFEYRCDSCGVRQEVLQSSREEGATCPYCTRPMVRLFSVSSVINTAKKENDSCSTGLCCPSCH